MEKRFDVFICVLQERAIRRLRKEGGERVDAQTGFSKRANDDNIVTVSD